MDKYYVSENLVLLKGNSLDVLRQLPSCSVHMCVTSPPYWALRDYGTATWEGGDPTCSHKPVSQPRTERQMGKLHGGAATVTAQDSGTRAFKSVCDICGAIRHDDQLGLEGAPEQYVANMVAVFREVRRVLRDDGTCWINIGDTYSSGGRKDTIPDALRVQKTNTSAKRAGKDGVDGTAMRSPANLPGIKPKDMIGIPWMLAFALRNDGWYLRSDIIWAKPNGMPESVTDRPTKSHEHIFLLTKSEHYYYDADAIREPHNEDSLARFRRNSSADGSQPYAMAQKPTGNERGSNKRDVWVVTTRGTSEAHFAAFPPDLVKPCIQAGTSEKGCCSECGAPWERVVERTNRNPQRDGEWKATGETYRNDLDRKGGFYPITETTGWQPTCKHDASVKPCTVLDPFGGTGIAPLTAKALGRRAIGIDLGEEYLAIARKRDQKGRWWDGRL